MTFSLRLVGAFALIASALSFAAATQTSSSCKSSEFWYQAKSCCLPHGGVPTPPTPPKGHDCPPTGYYWGSTQGCCVPSHLPPTNTPPPQCRSGWDWYPALHMCLPHIPTPTPTPTPVPSGVHHWKKRDVKSRASALCPTGLDACPIVGVTAGDYECLDVARELESCGGCTSLGKGQDCTAIAGAWNVGCEQGSCAVYTCASGFRRSHDGKSCIALV